MWIWLTAAFVVSLLAASIFGVRGAIVSFVLGALAATAPQLAALVILMQGETPAQALDFGWINAAAFRTAYWWMMAYPAAAVGLVLRSWLSRHERAKDVF